ncbi:FAD-dependent monooxygenase [Glaciimonas sp. PAMC28666]|uniref:FAD-dependent monooxygenase n=1 Tax=Glaciimonas sp. PAMC28666 TaxID=2807626 RepID=UPI001963FB7F|nr:FAD-dependent monooxygenase [Glaciimonas sp. PAMC28666]QRX81749.1 FAD-dependent monooxygenase [Glaciimonas sp. PAMC28666]
MTIASLSRIKTQVLIIGAGPVGQSLAIEMGQRGINCLVIDRNERVGMAPRAKTTNVRTREHMRRWGIAHKLAEASPFGVDYPSNVVFATRLSGQMLAKFDNAMYCAPGRNPLYSEHAQWIPQYVVEQVMRNHLETIPSATLRLQCQMVGFEQFDDHVVVTVENLATGEQQEIDAEYLVGCDGGRSLVREGIGATLEGTYGLSRNYNFVFRAPGMEKAHGLGKAIMYWQINADMPSLIGPMDKDDLWYFMPTALPPDVKITKENAADYIRLSTGIDLPYEILSADEWVASKFIATHYRDRRVFLAGDAAHLHPPFGGFGMNMGISDAVDLGWKLAAVLQGWGGPALLDSYERERRPVHRHVMNEATANHALLGNGLLQEGIEADTSEGAAIREQVGQRIRAGKLSEFYTLGTLLGDRYSDSPVIACTPHPQAPRDFLNYVPSAEPGCRAPHAWLHDGSSLFDHFGAGFTLLVSGNPEEAAPAAAVADAAQRGIPLKVIHPQMGAIHGLYPKRFTLIRPDQHVAWSGSEWPAANDVFDLVCGNPPARAARD